LCENDDIYDANGRRQADSTPLLLIEAMAT
jgi:hypothetical protein